MARSMAWPPVVENGRTKELIGPTANAQLVVMSLRSFGSLPYMDRNLFMKDVTFRGSDYAATTQRAAVERVLGRLSTLIADVDVNVTRISRQKVRIDVRYRDRETDKFQRVSDDG